MARKDSNRNLKEIKAMMGEDDEFLRPMVRYENRGSSPRYGKAQSSPRPAPGRGRARTPRTQYRKDTKV
jgi:hypothetical protein